MYERLASWEQYLCKCFDIFQISVWYTLWFKYITGFVPTVWLLCLHSRLIKASKLELETGILDKEIKNEEYKH